MPNPSLPEKPGIPKGPAIPLINPGEKPALSHGFPPIIPPIPFPNKPPPIPAKAPKGAPLQ